MEKVIEYIDLWKNIKYNRNNLLVYGNKKNFPDLPSTQKKITWNIDQDDSFSAF